MDEGVHDQRHVSPLLATAIYALPAIFVWLLLRKGYAPSTRRAAFSTQARLRFSEFWQRRSVDEEKGRSRIKSGMTEWALAC